jgi:arginase family enzyme
MNDHQQDQAERYKVKIITMDQFSSDIKLKFEDPIYISIDLDGIDPSFAPGVSHPEPGGFSTRDIITIISNISGKVIGADIVEYNPKKDINNITAITAAKLLKELMGKILK